jgi:hypothetical protein
MRNMTIDSPEFQQFLRSYSAALFWSSNDELDGETVNLDQYPTSTQADDHCRAACLAFFEANRADIDAAAEAYAPARDGESTGYDMAGHDFALTRNGHGAGYWDGDLPEELGARLTEAAKLAGECWPYLGDDQTVYVQ